MFILFCFIAGAQTSCEYATVTLTNGTSLQIPVSVKEKIFRAPKPDEIFNYGHRVIELGLMYLNFTDNCKKPDRNRTIRIMKFLLLMFKGSNCRSKYALEILRFLIQQKSLLSEREASEVFYGLFVNNQGKPDKYICADMQIEFVVRQQKNHIKTMTASKHNDSSIEKRTKAVHGIHSAWENFDKESHLVNRTKNHKNFSTIEDQQIMLQDLRTKRPFQIQPGSTFSNMTPVSSNYLKYIDPLNFNDGFLEKKKHDRGVWSVKVL